MDTMADRRPTPVHALDAILGAGAVVADPDGSLRLDDHAIEAQLHQRRERCWCLHCRREREQASILRLPAYLALLLEEDPRDEDEIVRVRHRIPRRRRPADDPPQPWDPRPSCHTAGV